MDYSINCQCGARLPVKASQAGTSITCSCGAVVAVPGLSKLRELAGHDAYETGPVDVIRNMFRRGELPSGGRCAVSGIATQDVIHLYVEAERVYSRSDQRLLHAWLGLLVSPILLAGMFQERRPDVGRETLVPTPLYVSAQHHARVCRAGQRALRKWLRTVPVYAQLLEAYPVARVLVGTVPEDRIIGPKKELT
jgi:hypothetical protein